MADDPHAARPPDVPEPVVVARRRFTPQLIWIVPIVAVLVGGWLAVRAILEKGPTITITFKTAEGLEAGKTKIKYKDVEIGLVKAVGLSPDRKGIVATAELSKQAEGFLVEDTQFFVVRPRVTAGGISGLSTLLSGGYIGIDIGKSKTTRRDFVGLEVAPIVTRDEPGRQFLLRSTELGSVDVGTPIYFRKLNVGQVVAEQLDKDGKGVTFTIFVNAPYDQYVTRGTRFWNASGIDVSVDAKGLQVHTESLVSVLVGGIAFQADSDAPPEPPADANTEFTLYADRTEALKRPDAVVDTYLLVFDGSVRGLSPGAPIDFRGVEVGEVVKIGVAVDPETLTFTMPVLVRLYPQRLAARHFIGTTLPPPENPGVRLSRIKRMIDKGLRAQLRSGNLLTGQLYVALDFFPDAAKVKGDPIGKKPPEIPTIPGTFEELQDNLTNVVKKLDKLQIEEIGADARKVLASLDETLKGVDSLLQGANGLVKRVDVDLVPDLRRALDNAGRALDSAGTTLKSADAVLSSESPLQSDLRQTLMEVNRTLAAVRALADTLERHPESLVRGKQAPASP
jgi:paraquat-inducible protein B